MSKTKILYVEDEPFLGRIVKESLESRDFEVVMVTDGNDVDAAFKMTQPDLCVLDIMLPTKDGYTLAKEIRVLAPGIPIIFVTAKVQTEDLLKGFEAGGNDYLRKPFSMEELIVRINNLLHLTQSQKPTHTSTSPESIAIGHFEFLPLRYELRVNDKARQLSHRESTLLQMLIDNKNATVLRKDILLKLWGDDSFFNSRNLDVYITKLRDYLKEDPAIKIITIKGIGYHFSVG
ncbi:response regulator transcription factor [Chryseolinea lacunae]|uniref:Response regulator transcription factor n=1 Tax=Chryseolinea lacunae TaxID=2801331 RepID=A0ABS1KRU1_9BACT|nr:response regulator transcription factor [Chryseolinea lacunae]MBL0742084.1 response regulator transcription factor [Chryseolinea lacunae]